MNQDKRPLNIKDLLKSKYAILLIFVVSIIFLFIFIFKPFEQTDLEKEQTKKIRQEIYSLYNTGKIKEVLPRLESFDEDNPDDVEMKTLLASSYWLIGKQKKALSVYEEILKIDSGNADTLYRLGILYRQLGKQELALENLQKAVNEKLDNALFKSELAKQYELLKKYDLAINQWKAALKLLPQKTDYQGSIWESIGGDYQNLGKLQDAKKAYETGLKFAPNSSSLKEKMSKLDNI